MTRSTTLDSLSHPTVSINTQSSSNTSAFVGVQKKDKSPVTVEQLVPLIFKVKSSDVNHRSDHFSYRWFVCPRWANSLHTFPVRLAVRHRLISTDLSGPLDDEDGGEEEEEEEAEEEEEKDEAEGVKLSDDDEDENESEIMVNQYPTQQM